MWLLIEVDNIKDVGKNENERYLLEESGVYWRFESTGNINVSAFGSRVHPATSDKDKML